MDRYVYAELDKIVHNRNDWRMAMRLFVELKDPVEPDMLKAAVKQAMKRYPYYSVELVIRKNRYQYIPNDREFTVVQGDTPLTLCGPEANYHNIAFRYSGKRVYFDINHCMTDGTGAYNIVKTVLYHYCTLRYDPNLDPKGIQVYQEGMEFNPAEWENPWEQVQGERCEPYVNKYVTDKPFILRSVLPRTEHYTNHRLEVDADAFMGFCKASDGTPNALIHVLLSRAIQKLNPGVQGIRCGICVDLRPYLNAPAATQEMVMLVMLPYHEKMAKYPLKDQVTLSKGMLTVATEKENFMRMVKNKVAGINYWIAAPTAAESLERCRAEPGNPFMTPTADISYCRNTNFGAVEQYITDFSISSILDCQLLTEINFINNTFMIDLEQDFAGDEYYEAFLAEFDTAGIAYRRKSTENGDLPLIALPLPEGEDKKGV